MPLNDIPKVILHEHIEGSVTPKLAKTLAARHSVTLPDGFIYSDNEYDKEAFPDGRYAYDESDFNAFIRTYDVVAGLIRTPDDYYLAVNDFLSRNAKQGLIYCELISSPFHICNPDGRDGPLNPQRYVQVMDAIENAIEDAKRDFGVETRLHAVGIRHLGAEHIERVCDFIGQNPRDSVTGFNIAGNESVGRFADFADAYRRLDALKLGRSFHAGEICSAKSIEQALDAGAMRIGHGVKAIEDPATIARLIENDITLEVSITSNLILVKEFAGQPEKHPVRKLYNSGVRITLNTDDAGIFGTTIAKEYRLAAELFGFKRTELLDISLCAIEAAFVDDATKRRLAERIYRSFSAEDLQMLVDLAREAASPALKERLTLRLQQAENYLAEA